MESKLIKNLKFDCYLKLLLYYIIVFLGHTYFGVSTHISSSKIFLQIFLHERFKENKLESILVDLGT